MTGNDSDLTSAVRDAARALAGHGEGSLVFHERRDDLRIEQHGRGGGEAVISSLSGVSIRRGLGPDRTSHRSRPSPRDIVELARGRPPAGSGSSEPGESGGDPAGARGWLEAAVVQMGRTIGTGATVRACWIEARQRLCLARPGLYPVTIVRHGRRVRIDAAVERGGRRASATLERVLPVSTEPEPPAPLAEAVAARALERLDARPGVCGPVTVVFAAGVGGLLAHESIGHALEGDVIAASALATVDGPIGSRDLSVIDDPRRGRVPWRVDDEGSPTAPVALLRDGRVTGALHDLASARRAGVASTGHGRRSSYRDPVLPRLGCTFLSPGRHRAADVLADTSMGILVRRMESAWTDPRSGRATFRVTDADAIEHGRSTHPLEPFLIYADTLEAWPTIDGVADDLAFDTCVGTCVREGQPLATSVGAPTFRIRVTSVADQ